MAQSQPLSAYAKLCRKINDSYDADIKKTAWMSAAVASLGPSVSAGIMVSLGVVGGALTPVTGPAALAIMSTLTVATGITHFLQRYKDLNRSRAMHLDAAKTLDGSIAPNHLSADNNDRKTVERADKPLAGRNPLAGGKPLAGDNPPIRNTSISLREGVKLREAATPTCMADLKIDMACDALSRIQNVREGAEGERTVNALLSRVKESVVDRLHGRASMDHPLSENAAFGVMIQVNDAFTAAANGVGHRFAATFKDTLDSIITEIGSHTSATQIKRESSKNQDLSV